MSNPADTTTADTSTDVPTAEPQGMVNDGKIRAWSHSRKGRIVGTVVGESDVWLHIRLTGDHSLRYGSISNVGRVDADGEVITARKSFLTEIGEVSA